MQRDEVQINAVLALVESVLQDGLIGVYLHGSAVLGGLRPDNDLDVLVVYRRSLNQRERVVLLDGLLDVSGRRARRKPGRPVELSVVVHADVHPWRYPPRIDFQYGEWLRADYEAGVIPVPRLDPDLALLVHTAANWGAALLGPRPTPALPTVPAGDLLRATAAGVPDLMDDVLTDTRNLLLTLARVWCTLSSRVVMPKDQAALWVLDRLPASHQPPMAMARRAYLGEVADDWQDHAEQVLDLSRYIGDRILAMAPQEAQGAPPHN